MKLIVGLGNPGTVYINSRHNIGFSVIRALSQFFKISLKKDAGTFSLSGRVKFKNQNIILAMPLTFMNLSGLAVRALVKKYKIDLPRPSLERNGALKEGRGLDNLLIVCDDLDLEFGRIKLRPNGSSAGHRGLESIIEYLNTEGFGRLRIGIGRPAPKIDAAGYVLGAFSKREKEQVPDIARRAGECCRTWLTQGINESMNIFNRYQFHFGGGNRG